MTALDTMAQPLEFLLTDGVTMRAQRREAGDRHAVLVHDLDADLDEVRSIGQALLAAGFTVTAIDRIGHGMSDDRPAGRSNRSLADDLVDLVDLLAVGSGVYLVGIGEAVAGCLTAAGSIRPSLVTLVSPRDVSTLDAAVLGADRSPTLIVFGAHEPAYETEARRLAAARPGPTLLIRIGTADQAGVLLAGPSGPQVANHIVGYARQIAPRPAERGS
jgi:hypothetical protein